MLLAANIEQTKRGNVVLRKYYEQCKCIKSNYTILDTFYRYIIPNSEEQASSVGQDTSTRTEHSTKV